MSERFEEIDRNFIKEVIWTYQNYTKHKTCSADAAMYGIGKACEKRKRDIEFAKRRS
jgi:hypothetical protein